MRLAWSVSGVALACVAGCWDVDRPAADPSHPCGAIVASVESMTLFTFVPSHMLAADFDGDGYKDVLGAEGRRIEMLFGNGHGGFTSGNSFEILMGAPKLIRAADFDRDGRADVVVLIDESLYVTFDAGTAWTFLGNASTFEIADLDQDGTPEVVAVIEGAPYDIPVVIEEPAMAEREIPLMAQLYAVARVASEGWRMGVGDLDGDGDTDVVIYDQVTSVVETYRNEGGSLVLAASVQIGMGDYDLIAADLDGDARVEILLVDETDPGNPLVLRGIELQSSTIALEIISRVAVDLNGDGVMDLVGVSPNEPMRVAWVLGHGDGTFCAPDGIAIPYAVGDLVSVDMDRNGLPELLAAKFPRFLTPLLDAPVLVRFRAP